MTPYHVEPHTKNGITSWWYFYQINDEFQVKVEGPDRVAVDGGEWSTLRSAAQAALELCEQSPVDVLAPWRRNGRTLMAIKNAKTAEWSILCGHGNTLDDTGVSFKTREEADLAIGGR